METLVIGIGNEYRSDDAAGIVLARTLSAKPPAAVRVTEATGEGISLMQAWEGYDSVILIDAVQSGHPPGTIHEWQAHAESLPAEFRMHSSHAFGVAEAIELARELKKLPARLIVYGIEGSCFDYGTELSPEVMGAIEKICKRINE